MNKTMYEYVVENGFDPLKSRFSPPNVIASAPNYAPMSQWNQGVADYLGELNHVNPYASDAEYIDSLQRVDYTERGQFYTHASLREYIVMIIYSPQVAINIKCQSRHNSIEVEGYIERTKTIGTNDFRASLTNYVGLVVQQTKTLDSGGLVTFPHHVILKAELYKFPFGFEERLHV